MHATYDFHFLNTVSQQLIAKLNDLPITALDTASLYALDAFQISENAKQGVYLLHYNGAPVYLGKADNVRARLAKHLNKLTGRQNVSLALVGYKALLLDKSMSTAANEDVLIGIFQQTHKGMWNGEGFGPNDPGKRRDDTKPGAFDLAFPIKDSLLVDFPNNLTTVGILLREMKKQLPYVLRYEIRGQELVPIDLTKVPRTARGLLQAVVCQLGAGWKGAILSYGMVLYRTDTSYVFGEELLP